MLSSFRLLFFFLCFCVRICCWCFDVACWCCLCFFLLLPLSTRTVVILKSLFSWFLFVFVFFCCCSLVAFQLYSSNRVCFVFAFYPSFNKATVLKIDTTELYSYLFFFVCFVCFAFDNKFHTLHWIMFACVFFWFCFFCLFCNFFTCFFYLFVCIVYNFLLHNLLTCLTCFLSFFPPLLELFSPCFFHFLLLYSADIILCTCSSL